MLSFYLQLHALFMFQKFFFLVIIYSYSTLYPLVKNPIEDFKNCMRQLATGVTVITTTKEDGSKEAVTINTFTSLSLDPLLILFSLKKSSFCYETFIKSKNFTVNILAEDQGYISNMCTKPLEDQWADIKLITNTDTNSPALEGTTAYLECKNYQSYDGGDHSIIIGKALNSFSFKNKKPLIYFRGKYIKPESA
jgi:flavin reductase (DIM6/NTAB) family NADH-FMN oxidoreductase RutF